MLLQQGGPLEGRSGKLERLVELLGTVPAGDKALVYPYVLSDFFKVEQPWVEAHRAVYEQIISQGWNPERKAFVQYYGSDVLDASNLLMPMVKFMGPTDPRICSTLDQTMAELVSDSLVYRYDPSAAADDGLGGSAEGTFCICTFWLVEALTRAGRAEEARLIMEKMFTYANHLGLYAEEIGGSGEALGNFPQAFTHLALISAAVNLDRKLGGGSAG